MLRLPPRSTRTATLFPYTTLFRSLDLNEASALHGKLMELRGSDLRIDASGVERIGVQCAQVLVAGARGWEADRKSFLIEKASDAFEKTMQLDRKSTRLNSSH